MSQTEPLGGRASADGSAPPTAYIIHGPHLALMGLIGYLAAEDHLDALAALNGVSYVEIVPTGDANKPSFDLILEADDETWQVLEPQVGVIWDALTALTGTGWIVKRWPAPILNFQGRTTVLGRSGIGQRLRADGLAEAAALAERSDGFRIRPRPQGGFRVATLHGALDFEEAHQVDEAIFRANIPGQTVMAASTRFAALASKLEPGGVAAEVFRPTVAVITSTSASMTQDIRPHLPDLLFNVNHQMIRVTAPDAADQLARTLRQVSTSSPPADAVLIARGGGEPEVLQRLASDAVRHEVASLRSSGTYVVAAIGHGDLHVDIGADAHALTPSTGAQIIRERFHEVPMKQRRAIGRAIDALTRLTLNGRTRPEELVDGLSASLASFDADLTTFVQRHSQPDADPTF